MSNYKKHIDDFFKEKLGNYRESPPPEAWSEIDAKLDGLTPGPAGFQYRWFVHIGIVSLLLILGVTLLRNYTNTQSQGSGTIAMNATPTANATRQASPSTGAATTEQGITASTNATSGNDANTAAPGQTSATNATNNGSRNGNNNVPVVTANTQKNNNAAQRKQASGKQSTAQHKHYIQPVKIGFANNTTVNNTYNTSLSNTHNNNLSNPAPEQDANDNQVQAASPNTTLSVVTKPETQANNAKSPVNKPNTSIAAKNSNTRTQPSFPRFEAGVKTGFESGFNNEAANKFVVSPYVQYNLSRKFALMTQPGVKLSSTPDKTIGTPQTYYNANLEDGALTSQTVISHPVLGGGSVTEYTTTYHYIQPHDSIIKTNRIGGNTMEFEIPILLKYNLTKKLSVYGGVNFTYNKYTTINENTYTAKGLVRTIDSTIVSINTPTTTPQGLGFTYTGKPIADYQKMNAAHTGYEFSTGYMIGFSYTCCKKWLFDALMEQSPAKPDVKAGYNINTPLSSTYFRLSIGYKLE